MSDTCSVLEAATRLGVSERTARDLIRKGEFPVPVIHIGRLWRVPVRPLERLLNGETQEAS